MIQKLARGIKRMVIGLFSLVAAYILLAITFSLLGTNPDQSNCEHQYAIYVASNGVHLDIILPVYNHQGSWINEIELAYTHQYLAFGWGDREFYINTPQWRDLRIQTAFKAVVINSKAAMHVTGHSQIGKHWIEVPLCGNQMSSLTQYIEGTFKRDEGGFIKIPVKGYGTNDVFYEAHGRFNLVNTCNRWVNMGLKAAEVKTSLWSPFDFGVLHHLRK